jgi:pimeloyl-ACP methyl ester carboxylesterase
LRLKKQKLLVEEELELRARDGVRVSARLWHRGGRGRNLILLAPGFAQHKDTPIMRRVSAMLADYGDLLCIDFRGNGGSGGRYHFGSQEHLDLEAAFAYARRHGGEVELIGFSMGGTIALRAASEFPGTVKRLYLVSGPTCVEDVAKTLGPLRQAATLWLHPGALKLRFWAGSQYFFRWGRIFAPKPSWQGLASRLAVPVSFLVGLRDQLVLPRLSRRVYEAVPSMKLWTEFPAGNHAEYMAVMQQFEFRRWFLMSRKALSAPKKRRE